MNKLIESLQRILMQIATGMNKNPNELSMLDEYELSIT